MRNEKVHQKLEELNYQRVVAKLFAKNGSLLLNVFGKLEGSQGEINNDEYLIINRDGDFKVVPDDFDKAKVVGNVIEFSISNDVKLYVGKA